MDLQLTDKLALVTGSTAGIGMAIAKQLASEGASVIVNGRSQESVDEAIKSLSSTEGKVMGLAADNVNVMIGVRLSRAYLPKMLDKNWGRIIFVSSESGIQTWFDL